MVDNTVTDNSTIKNRQELRRCFYKKKRTKNKIRTFINEKLQKNVLNIFNKNRSSYIR